MGMFDYVKYAAPCWKCQRPLGKDNFQTKDHHQSLAVVKPHKIKNFYATCPQCLAWNEYKVKIKITRIPQPEEQQQQDTHDD